MRYAQGQESSDYLVLPCLVKSTSNKEKLQNSNPSEVWNISDQFCPTDAKIPSALVDIQHPQETKTSCQKYIHIDVSKISAHLVILSPECQ